MALVKFQRVGIKGVSACVPKTIQRNADLTDVIAPEEIEKTISTIGIREKRIAAPEVCASDLCCKAAETLLRDLDVDPATIDLLIFLSQTPDYKTPATAPSLQARLELPTGTACFDINLACSGYVYGLSTAFAYAMLEGIQRVLLLVGETFSKIVSPKDKVNAPLYGDAGTATLIEKGDYGTSYFSLNSDGSGKDAIIVPAGAYRHPSTVENLQEKEMEEGNVRSAHQIYMDGMEVFNFTMRVVPKDVKAVMEFAGVTLEQVDYVVFHQANKFMTDFFAKKLKCPAEKVPYSLDKYGNVSSPTIPLTIASELSEILRNSDKKLILSGFGGGLSWASAVIDFKHCQISGVIEY
jgi:3-oxoacyl-[acyl-carrier-protein] synthase-3